MGGGGGEQCYLYRDLGRGSYGGDIFCLQQALKKEVRAPELQMQLQLQLRAGGRVRLAPTRGAPAARHTGAPRPKTPRWETKPRRGALGGRTGGEGRRGKGGGGRRAAAGAEQRRPDIRRRRRVPGRSRRGARRIPVRRWCRGVGCASQGTGGVEGGGCGGAAPRCCAARQFSRDASAAGAGARQGGRRGVNGRARRCIGPKRGSAAVPGRCGAGKRASCGRGEAPRQQMQMLLLAQWFPVPLRKRLRPQNGQSTQRAALAQDGALSVRGVAPRALPLLHAPPRRLTRRTRPAPTSLRATSAAHRAPSMARRRSLRWRRGRRRWGCSRPRYVWQNRAALGEISDGPWWSQIRAGT